MWLSGPTSYDTCFLEWSKALSPLTAIRQQGTQHHGFTSVA